jgi:hypothetical protein
MNLSFFFFLAVCSFLVQFFYGQCMHGSSAKE